MYTAWALAITLATAQQASPSAQAPKVDRTTVSGGAVYTYEGIKGFVLRSAEKMPADQFDFQPTPDVRSFGQILAHVTDGNYLLCSSALGEANPNGTVMDKVEKDKLGRDALLAKLKESFAYCDRAYALFTDTNATDPLQFLGSKRPRVGLHWFHISHAFEHYGNLVTYMRLKGIVPPSSEPAPKTAPKK